LSRYSTDRKVVEMGILKVRTLGNDRYSTITTPSTSLVGVPAKINSPRPYGGVQRGCGVEGANLNKYCIAEVTNYPPSSSRTPILYIQRISTLSASFDQTFLLSTHIAVQKSFCDANENALGHSLTPENHFPFFMLQLNEGSLLHTDSQHILRQP
jgi:hypothetical protein